MKILYFEAFYENSASATKIQTIRYCISLLAMVIVFSYAIHEGYYLSDSFARPILWQNLSIRSYKYF